MQKDVTSNGEAFGTLQAKELGKGCSRTHSIYALFILILSRKRIYERDTNTFLHPFRVFKLLPDLMT